MYHSAAESNDSIHTVAYTTFCWLWRSLLPSIIIMKLMSDLCWTCQQNSTAILRAANCSEGDKSETTKIAEEHLRIVQVERSFYKTTCDKCRDSIHTSLKMVYFSCHLCLPALHQIRGIFRSITRLIMPNRFTSLAILSSLFPHSL